MSDPQYNSVDTNSLESVGRRKKMKHKKRVGTSIMEDGDSAHWVKSGRRKASGAAETKKRFKKNTITVKPAGKKKIRVKK